MIRSTLCLSFPLMRIFGFEVFIIELLPICMQPSPPHQKGVICDSVLDWSIGWCKRGVRLINMRDKSCELKVLLQDKCFLTTLKTAISGNGCASAHAFDATKYWDD